MSILRSILIKLGLADLSAERTPISVFLLDDDERRHRWFEKRFVGDDLDIAETVEQAKEYLAEGKYDAIFLDHDLLPLHYESNDHDDFDQTGYAVAEWLNEKSELQPRLRSSCTLAMPMPRSVWFKNSGIRPKRRILAHSRCLI